MCAGLRLQGYSLLFSGGVKGRLVGGKVGQDWGKAVVATALHQPACPGGVTGRRLARFFPASSALGDSATGEPVPVTNVVSQMGCGRSCRPELI